MSKQIYISENGDWGDADSLSFINADNWTEQDYDTLHGMTWSGLMEYMDATLSDGGDYEGFTPTQYELALELLNGDAGTDEVTQ